MAAYTKDLQLTLEVLTAIRSGFSAQIAFDSALKTLQSSFGSGRYPQSAETALERLKGWFDDFKREIPIFATSWESPETFDAISSMNLLRDLKSDLLWLRPFVEEALATTDLPGNPEAVKLLAAVTLRVAHGRVVYSETLYSSLMQLRVTDMAQQVSFEVESAREHQQMTQGIVTTLASRTDLSSDFCERLRFEAGLIPCDLRSQVHDLNVLLNAYTKEFTFEVAEFSREEARPWIDAQIPPVAAGYWRAYDFTPSDFIAWSQAGITGAPLAAQWHRCYFSPEVAIRWIWQGFSPTLALPWFREGFDPARAAAMVKRGVIDPTKAPKRSSSDEDAS